jgi:hypothetical protein
VALNDILDAEDWDKIRDIFQDIYLLAFKAMDDTEKCKKAGFKLLRTLKKITIRNANMASADFKVMKETYGVICLWI